MIFNIDDRLALTLIRLARKLTSNTKVDEMLKKAEDLQNWHTEDLDR